MKRSGTSSATSQEKALKKRLRKVDIVLIGYEKCGVILG
jgi:hypothetical protein